MPELLERGHIYIAQPPLYKVKHGKQERYIKDDHELKQYLLGLALTDAELHTQEDRPPLTGETLEKIANEYLLAEAVIERMSSLIDREVMHALLRHPDMDLSSETGAAESAARLAAHVATVKIEPEYDAATEEFRLKITRIHHGNVAHRYLDQDFLDSGDYTQIRKTAQVLDGLMGPALMSNAEIRSKWSATSSKRSTGSCRK